MRENYTDYMIKLKLSPLDEWVVAHNCVGWDRYDENGDLKQPVWMDQCHILAVTETPFVDSEKIGLYSMAYLRQILDYLPKNDIVELGYLKDGPLYIKHSNMVFTLARRVEESKESDDS